MSQDFFHSRKLSTLEATWLGRFLIPEGNMIYAVIPLQFFNVRMFMIEARLGTICSLMKSVFCLGQGWVFSFLLMISPLEACTPILKDNVQVQGALSQSFYWLLQEKPVN